MNEVQNEQEWTCENEQKDVVFVNVEVDAVAVGMCDDIDDIQVLPA